MSGEFRRDDLNGDGTTPVTATATAPNGSFSPPGSPDPNNNTDNARPGTSGRVSLGNGAQIDYNKRVEDVMYSDIGINTLLNRLKQSIASARDFAAFLKKRSSLEEEQAKGLKRLTQQQLDNVKRGEVRGGTYAQQLTEVLRVHDRMADNGMQFALSLHQMHEDLDVLSANMERNRKAFKHEGLAAEKEATDAEQAMEKARARYEGLADDYDRARAGDTKAGRRLGIKGPKSAEQHEQDLLRKAQAAEQEYREKVGQAKSTREQLVASSRPKYVKELEKSIRECDSALALQLQKFATFNEKLLLGNGLAVQPLSDSSNLQRSLRDLVLDVDNDRDFNTYLESHHTDIPHRSAQQLDFKQHSVFAPKTQAPRQPTLTSQPPVQSPVQPSLQPTAQPPLAVVNTPSQPGSMNSRYAAQPPPQSSFHGPAHSSPTSYGYQSGPAPPVQDMRTPSPGYTPTATQSPYNPSSAPLRDTYNAPPYPTLSAEQAHSGFGSTPQQTTGTIASASPLASSPAQHRSGPPSASPRGRVFGVTLDDLFARDASAVPIIVFQCIQAVDMFGLEIEGIYRQTGNMAQVNRLRSAFDSLPPNSPDLDFRNPSNFGHDVNAVTSLMKMFFRELPDPLFTKAGYGGFIEAAQVDQEDQRRDGLHQCINDLPDPNYATLRALVLHLHRVMQNDGRTRMTAANLAVCLAPTLMGAHQGPHIADASWQQRVLETILSNATAIFDED